MTAPRSIDGMPHQHDAEAYPQAKMTADQYNQDGYQGGEQTSENGC